MFDILNLALPYFGLIFHRLRLWQGQRPAGAGFGMDELLPALRFAARLAVRHHVEDAVCGTQ